jgi:RNA polymerase sigma-70 factor (ECF subfamily)
VVPDDPELEPEIIAAVHAVRAGDVQAYATIVKRFQGPLMTLCTAILRDRQAADELTQDVLVRAYQRLETFDVRRPLKTWLVKIAYCLAQQRWRTRVRETARREAAATRLHQIRNDSGAADRLLADEQSQLLWQAVYALPMAQRTAVVLYYRENLTVQEVAQAMGISPGTVKTHLFRARAQIQVNLRALGFEEGDRS